MMENETAKKNLSIRMSERLLKDLNKLTKEVHDKLGLHITRNTLITTALEKAVKKGPNFIAC